ncbi:MAG: hypothetical protein IPL70_07270 [Uliginosibacterium sp.]|nr:hypothetical protein [Uliginosibacterium sp.]
MLGALHQLAQLCVRQAVQDRAGNQVEVEGDIGVKVEKNSAEKPAPMILAGRWPDPAVCDERRTLRANRSGSHLDGKSDSRIGIFTAITGKAFVKTDAGERIGLEAGEAA